jgi:hypothetical protein
VGEGVGTRERRVVFTSFYPCLPLPSSFFSPLALLRADISNTLRSVARVLKSKSPKTRIGVLGLLRKLAEVLPASVAEQVPLLVPGVLSAMNVGALRCGHAANILSDGWPGMMVASCDGGDH